MSRKIAVDTPTDASAARTRTRNALVITGIILLGLVIAAYFMTEQKLRPYTGGVFRASSEYVTIVDRHTGKDIGVPRAMLSSMERLVLDRRNKVKVLRIKLNDLPRDGDILKAAADFVVGVEVEFMSGFRIETRAVRTSGADFQNEVGRQLGKAMARFDDMLARGEFRPTSPKKVYMQ